MVSVLPAGFYMEPQLAKAQAETRFADDLLKKEVNDFLGFDCHAVDREKPMAVLLRQVATPNFETLRFVEKAEQIGMTHRILEYTRDRFVTANIDKVHLGKIISFMGNGKNGGRKLAVKKVIDFNSSNGKRLDCITTNKGESFVDFHHRLFKNVLPQESFGEISSCLWEMGRAPVRYYEKIFALATVYWVIFENFLLSGKEARFTEEIVVPAYEKIKERFGQRPFIVNLLPFEREADVFWTYYPGLVANCV